MIVFSMKDLLELVTVVILHNVLMIVVLEVVVEIVQLRHFRPPSLSNYKSDRVNITLTSIFLLQIVQDRLWPGYSNLINVSICSLS